VEEWKESGRGRVELRRAVWANVVTDAVDIVVTGLAMANGGNWEGRGTLCGWCGGGVFGDGVGGVGDGVRV